MNQENVWSLLVKRLSGEATSSELTELEELLRAHPELHYSVQPIMDLWQADNQPDKTRGQEAFLRHIRRMGELGVDFAAAEIDQSLLLSGTRRKARIFKFAAVATPLVILLLIAG